MRTLNNLVGQRFGRWTVISYQGQNKFKHSVWICKCDCGKEKTISTCSLKGGTSKSCGCLVGEMAAEHCRKDFSTHHMSYSRLYNIWHRMKQRCLNKNDSDFPAYGGRGIRICAEWADRFESFMNWSQSNGYSKDLTLDRIDVNGNYHPDNCRWATIKKQSNNRTTSRYLNYQGTIHTMSEWADLSGINYSTFQNRVRKGWDVGKIINTPIRGDHRDDA